MDYRVYKLNFMQRIEVMGISLACCLVISYLFYENFWAIVVLPVVYYILQKREVNRQIRKRKRELSKQFLDAMRTVTSSLLAGLSMENAWREAEQEMEILYGPGADMYMEIVNINQAVSLREPIEKLVEDFGKRSGIEDIIGFAEVFLFAKRCGGDYVGMIDSTVTHMRQKQDTENEIDVMITSKRLEQKVMDVIPLLILAYMKLTSGDYLSVLYHNPKGILTMSGCLIVYGIAFLLAERILTIEV